MKVLSGKSPIRVIGAICLGLALGLTGCGNGVSSPLGSGKPQEMISDLPRQEPGEIHSAALEGLASANTAFALDLYGQLKADEGNLFFSPYSISSALAMTYAGARGTTAEEMAGVFHFPPDDSALHAGFNTLGQYLDGLAEMDQPEDQGDPFQLNVANAIWGQLDYHFEPAFLDTLAANYGAGLQLLDYIQEPEKSRQTINQWVSDQTEEKIRDLIPAGAIDSSTRLVLSNAIYFKAAWLEAFEESLTKDGPFFGLDGEVYQVPLMSLGSDASFPYYEGNGFQAVSLPYVGGQVSLLVLLPDTGTFAEFEAGLTSDELGGILAGMAYRPLRLRFPKFEFESEFSLAGTLAAMGMPAAFSEAADFSGMTGARDLFISDVFHKAYIGVDEEGTEAAAATAVIMTLTSAPADPLELTVDRPFLFLIREDQTGTVLFMGRVTQP